MRKLYASTLFILLLTFYAIPSYVTIIIFIILVLVIFVAYRSRQRSKQYLKLKQQEINLQNDALLALLSDKESLSGEKNDLLIRLESLTTEKEWLLEEVHHRVKNNLQIVMSLLYNQSAYLQNKDAREALKDSQHRVQAISMIHQKLYGKTNVATILIADYVNDLVSYLSDCYDTIERKIRFKLMVAPLSLDISQAVPVGLILNEAITNAIKYAFSKDGGEITIEAHLTADDNILLRITDNGRGLPPGFNVEQTTSLGMEMMKALSKQLSGSVDIRNDAGVAVLIQFKHKSL